MNRQDFFSEKACEHFSEMLCEPEMTFFSFGLDLTAPSRLELPWEVCCFLQNSPQQSPEPHRLKLQNRGVDGCCE